MSRYFLNSENCDPFESWLKCRPKAQAKSQGCKCGLECLQGFNAGRPCGPVPSRAAIRPPPVFCVTGCPGHTIMRRFPQGGNRLTFSSLAAWLGRLPVIELDTIISQPRNAR